MGASLASLVPELRDAAAALVDACGVAGLLPQITSTRRSHSEQRRLYSRFLAGKSGYPVAPPGTSAHEYGEAFDLVVTPMEALADVGYTWQTWGGGWNPADAIHFELLGASQLAAQRGQQNIVQRVAESYDALPWYATILAPAAAVTEKVKPEDFTKSYLLCKTFGIFC